MFNDPFPLLDELETFIDQMVEETAEAEDETSQRPQFVITELPQAEWCLRQLSRLKEKEEEVIKTAEEEIAKITAWKEAEIGKINRRCERLEAALKEYHRRRLEANGEDKTIVLPSGDLIARACPPEFIKDEEKVIDWALKNAPEYIKTIQKLDWAGLKKNLTPTGETAVTKDGEVVPGIEVRRRGIEFRIKLK